jgi:hypothetical protein
MKMLLQTFCIDLNNLKKAAPQTTICKEAKDRKKVAKQAATCR